MSKEWVKQIKLKNVKVKILTSISGNTTPTFAIDLKN
jgi:hypothetical protein